MIGAALYFLATTLLLAGIYLVEDQPQASRPLFFISGAVYALVGILAMGLGSSNLRFVLALTIVWQIWNCYAGWRRLYAKAQLQYRLIQSLTVLAAANLCLYVTVLFDFADIEQWLDEFTLMAALFTLGRTIVGLTRARLDKNFAPLKDLPTVSLLIPARNEDHALTECLHSAVAIDYPKLEIIVLDDCSHDRTPEIIRGFAHEGVRFIKTDELPPDWLGKNYSQHRLATEASGDILLFADVDMRLAPNSVSQLVRQMEVRKLQMISVLPLRVVRDNLANYFAPLIGWWQTILPVNLVGQRPVGSNCYMITRTAYEHIGGHAVFSRTIMPERFFANILKREYQYVISDQRLDINIRKRLASQFETIVRTYYPLAGATPGMVLIWSLLGLTVFLAPVYLALSAASLSGLASWLLLLAALSFYNRRTQPVSWGLSFVQIPLVMVVEIGLLIISMIRYETAGVVWKERNICYPKLDVIPHLPPLSD